MTITQLKIELYKELLKLNREEMTDLEVDIMYILSKDRVIQNKLEKPKLKYKNLLHKLRYDLNKIKEHDEYHYYEGNYFQMFLDYLSINGEDSCVKELSEDQIIYYTQDINGIYSDILLTLNNDQLNYKILSELSSKKVSDEEFNNFFKNSENKFGSLKSII